MNSDQFSMFSIQGSLCVSSRTVSNRFDSAAFCGGLRFSSSATNVRFQSMRKAHFVYLLVVLLLTVGTMPAQTITGAITGLVSDATGGVAPNVKVTATNQGTNVQFNATTNSAGVCSLLFLP